MKTRVIYHRADYDGLFCREIARRFLPKENVEFVGWHFGDPPLAWPKADELTIVMDLPMDAPFNCEFHGALRGYALHLRCCGNPRRFFNYPNVVWIDHHKSAIDTHPPTIPGYRIDGVAACRLAWQWFAANYGGEEHNDASFKPGTLPEFEHFAKQLVREPYAVQLAGEYDVADHRNPDAELLQHGLNSMTLSPEDFEVIIQSLLEHSERAISLTKAIVSDGHKMKQITEKRYADVTKEQAFDLTFEGLKFLACNTHYRDLRTQLFKSALQPHHQAMLGFYWNGKKREWVVSMYTSNGSDLDLSVIARKYGGGGHRGACGFRIATLPFSLL